MKIKFMYHQISDINQLYTNEENNELSEFFGGPVVAKTYKGKEYCEKVLRITLSKLSGFCEIRYEGCQERIAREIFSATTSEGKYTFVFTIDTYEESNARLQVSINFVPNEEYGETTFAGKYNKALETLKLALRDTLKNDWNQCTWLIDTQSEFLCTNLYPHIFKIENKLRAFVSKVLIRHLGIEWLKRAGLEEYNDSVKNMESYFNQRVPEFDGINVAFLSMTLETLFEILFEGIVYEEKLVITNAELMTLKKIIRAKDSQNIENFIFGKRKIEVEIWSGLFVQYFSNADAFKSSVTQFIKDRNHVAHNKLLSFATYKQICNELSMFERLLDSATETFEQNDESEEMLQTWEIENEQAQYSEEYEELYWRTRISEETGVDILDSNQIFDMFCETISNIYESLKDRYHFDPCFEVSSYNEPTDSGTTLIFTVLCNGVQDRRLEVSTKILIDDDMDEDSYLDLLCTIDTVEVLKATILYHNGSGHEGEEGLAVADSDSEYDDSHVDEFLQDLFNYVENKLNPYIGELEVLKYTAVTQGDDYPVADFACEECGKLGVSISESFLPIGQCCFCGYENDVKICEACGTVYDSDGGDGHLCSTCLPKVDD